MNRCYRSRFVAKEYNDHEIDGLFAATPPLEALRLLVGKAATCDASNANVADMVFMTNDVARALVRHPYIEVCIELPTDALADGESPDEWVGLPRISLYGT